LIVTGFDSFATRTKNVENKPIVNERGMRKWTHFIDLDTHQELDNRQTPKPHFAAPPAPKPAPTILQTINTAGSSSSIGPSMNIAATAAGKARASLGPNANAIRSRVPRISNMGVGGTVYQRFALPGGLPGGGRRFLESIDEKPVVGGFAGLTEKDIEEKASFCFNFESTRHLSPYGVDAKGDVLVVDRMPSSFLMMFPFSYSSWSNSNVLEPRCR